MQLPHFDSAQPRLSLEITLHGQVQGVGLRPALARLAARNQVWGSVSNSIGGVTLHLEGSTAAVRRCLQELGESLPREADISEMTVTEVAWRGVTEFLIQKRESDQAAVATSVRPDVAVCPECLAETTTHGNRREGYPWTSCTRCGPRYSIVRALPFERELTAFAHFPLCPECKSEYTNPDDRRFHAQTTGCPACGPQIWCTDQHGHPIASAPTALQTAVQAIRAGQILALCGIGGYQLVCDATNNAAVSQLRVRKQRPGKPFAIMVSSVQVALQYAIFEEPARVALQSDANPIVLLPARTGNGLAPAIHPGLTTVGIMLPTSPLHWLLIHKAGVPLVMTSGNRESEPLVSTPRAALDGLQGIADVWLHHDRPIVRPIDDSVVRWIAGRWATMRLGRGLAPLPLSVSVKGRPALLATGGHQKTTIALSNGHQAVLGPHVGDLTDLKTREHYVAHAQDFQQLYGTNPQFIVHDLHPQFFTTEWAHRQPQSRMAVQHHHAHIVAGMIEQQWLEREVLGLAGDGTGYGTDGTIWGGEILRVTVTDFERVGHLRTFPLLGGEAAILDPSRLGLALIQESATGHSEFTYLTPFEWERVRQLQPLLRNSRTALRTSSLGRLFDGTAALILGIAQVDYEGQPAQLLEAACDLADTESYPFAIENSVPWQINWQPMIRSLLADRAAGVLPGQMAMRFHRGLADILASVCQKYPHLPVVLGGGVFQNRILVELLVQKLERHPQPLASPGRIPTNDGGLAAGQLAIGLARHSLAR